MAPLELPFGDLEIEIDAISSFARDFIRYDSTHVLPRLKESLINARSASGDDDLIWEIPEVSPLRTETSNGEFRARANGSGSRQKGAKVYGEVSSIWQIRPVRTAGSRHGAATTFALVGKASTRLKIFQEVDPDPPAELAMWRMEIGDEAAPGAFFHVQVLGESDSPPFPGNLDIPRLPTIMFTPMLAFDFLLGELFQERWPNHLAQAKYRSDVQRWRELQSHRLFKLMDWQIRELRDSKDSPLPFMKRKWPPSDLFCR